MLLNVCYTLIKLYGINKKGTLGTIYIFFFFWMVLCYRYLLQILPLALLFLLLS